MGHTGTGGRGQGAGERAGGRCLKLPFLMGKADSPSVEVGWTVRGAHYVRSRQWQMMGVRLSETPWACVSKVRDTVRPQERQNRHIIRVNTRHQHRAIITRVEQERGRLGSGGSKEGNFLDVKEGEVVGICAKHLWLLPTKEA